VHIEKNPSLPIIINNIYGWRWGWKKNRQLILSVTIAVGVGEGSFKKLGVSRSVMWAEAPGCGH
jgi:hypothetical protein